MFGESGTIILTRSKEQATYTTYRKYYCSHEEMALNDYPKAPEEQLSTVKQNLAIISRDLQKAKEDTSDENNDDVNSPEEF